MLVKREFTNHFWLSSSITWEDCYSLTLKLRPLWSMLSNQSRRASLLSEALKASV